MESPDNIRAHREDGILELVWKDDLVCKIPFALVRRSCPCASCVDEMTGRQILQPESVPEDIKPESIQLAGNYAIKIEWSDEHNTGLFTWSHLRKLGHRDPV